MPVHDWTRVDTGIFHDFHLEWLASIKHALNHGLLPEGYYSLAEQFAGPFAPDVLTLQAGKRREEPHRARQRNGSAPVLDKPRRRPIAETEMGSYRSKQRILTVRHVSDDEIVAAIEIVSPGNKSHKSRFEQFVEKSAWFLDERIHLSIIDLFPLSRRDPAGVHGAIWEAICDEKYMMPRGKKNRTVVSYECGPVIRAYVEHFAVGDKLPDMSLFLELGGCVEVPLETTYRAAFAEVPKRWRDVLE
jgi:hypothetical protein